MDENDININPSHGQPGEPGKPSEGTTGGQGGAGGQGGTGHELGGAGGSGGAGGEAHRGPRGYQGETGATGKGAPKRAMIGYVILSIALILVSVYAWRTHNKVVDICKHHPTYVCKK